MDCFPPDCDPGVAMTVFFEVSERPQCRSFCGGCQRLLLSLAASLRRLRLKIIGALLGEPLR